MNLYDKLLDRFREMAESTNPDFFVLNANNKVPEMLAEAAVMVVYEHQNDQERMSYTDIVTGA